MTLYVMQLVQSQGNVIAEIRLTELLFQDFLMSKPVRDDSQHSFGLTCLLLEDNIASKISTALKPCSTSPSSMVPSKLEEAALKNAERLREICQTTPSLKEYFRIAALAVEVCASATPDTRKKVSALALHAVERTENVIENKACISMSPQLKQTLNKFERHISIIQAAIPERGSKPPKFGLEYHCESMILKAKLDRNYKDLALAASRKEYILEIATISTRAASALCDIPAPGLGFLKPIVGMAVVICETAKTVNGNREAAIALTRHAQDITSSVVERANKTLHDPESVTTLRLTLEDIHAFLKLLQGRKRLISWIFAAKE
ncbi:hypothetical protein MSAN_00183800 [Mycena sanguinolenta]|uniref:Uncharacterized protein n=1 Tax=Mycena sanguinolenta TaxID=230812 RepID=A0A8H6ZEM3_9AGAR|nr:hypothetical protein MSAN_00183800 [Mycena sanguinolenta]